MGTGGSSASACRRPPARSARPRPQSSQAMWPGRAGRRWCRRATILPRFWRGSALIRANGRGSSISPAPCPIRRGTVRLCCPGARRSPRSTFRPERTPERMEHGGDIFLSGTVLLAAALAFVLLFRRLGLGAVLGYLVGGSIIGPQVLGLVADPELIVGFAEIGIVLLLFLVGLELAPARLWQLKRDIFGLGMSQVVVSGLVLAGFVFLVTGSTWGAALGLGLPLALSSTAQVLPLLQSQGRLNTPTGERAFSILLFQDLSIVPLLTIIAALSRAPQTGPQTPGWLLALYAVAAIGGLVIAGRYGLAPLLKLIGKVAERELFIVAGLFAVFGSAALMNAIGLSAALGAFIAGVMLADSPFRHELEADID